jgi:peptide chain release factor 3
MLLDAAKGLEPQTLKLFDVCRRGNIPVITVINKWDRPGLEALELVDQIHQRIGLRPTPLTWPVGIAGDFRGVLDRASGDFIKFTRTAGGATRAPEEHIPAEEAQGEGPAWQVALEEHNLLAADGSDHDNASFLAGKTTPVLFSAATLNFGVGQLLRTLVDIAPGPADRATRDGNTRELDSPFSAFVFKVQAGMDSSHRDHLAFARVCSGTFKRGMVVTQQRTKRPFATKYAQSVFGRERATADLAYPGDIIGLVNASALGIGDSLYVDEAVEFPPIPRFAPEHFSVIRARDAGRHKQFRRGIEQLDQEGIVQVLRSDLRGDQAPVLAAVGPMQFEVVEHRLEHEFGATTSQERLPYTMARSIDVQDVQLVNQHPGAEALTRSDGATLALFTDRWRLHTLAQKNPDVAFVSLAAGTD